MYNFLFSEVFWIKTLATALIAALATIIAAGLFYNYEIKTGYENSEKILKGHKDLSLEHKGLSSEHRELLTGHYKVYQGVELIKNDVEYIRDGLHSFIRDFTEEKTKQGMRYDNLNDKQKDIVSNVNNIMSMADELKRLATENVELRKDLLREQEKNQELLARKEIKPKRDYSR